MPLALASEGQGTRDLMTNFLSAEFIRRQFAIWEGEPTGEPNLFPDLPICRPHDLPKTWLGRSLALPLNTPRCA